MNLKLIKTMYRKSTINVMEVLAIQDWERCSMICLTVLQAHTPYHEGRLWSFGVRWIVPGGPAAEMAEAAGIVQTSGHLNQWQVDHQQPRHLPSFFLLWKKRCFSKDFLSIRDSWYIVDATQKSGENSHHLRFVSFKTVLKKSLRTNGKEW